MKAFKSILCPVDFSEFSRRALDHALAVARCYGATVTALHVATPLPTGVNVPAYLGAEVAVPMALPATDRAVLREQVQRLADAERAPGVPVNVAVEEAPDVHREILVQAERLGSDLIVLGTHGRSGFERLFLGSTAERVLRKARCPVMTVPPLMPDAVPRGPVPFTRIVCAVDFSPSSTRALEYALSLTRHGGGALTLIHVVEVIPLYYDYSPPAVVDVAAWARDAQRRLRALVPDAVRADCHVDEIAAAGKPYREIVSLAGALGNDLIVMGVRGRSTADLAFFGSTANHVIRDARCAVLTLRA